LESLEMTSRFTASCAHVRRWGALTLALVLASRGAAAQVFVLDAGPDLDVLPPATYVDLGASLRGPKRLDYPNTRSIVWRQLSGPRVTIAGADTLWPRVTPSRPGTVRLHLRFVDPIEGLFTDDVIVRFWGAGQEAELTGEARKWHKLTLTFTNDGVLSESGPVNPFLTLRLIVSFFHPDSGTHVNVPGFFAADGNAAESGATAGTKWRANFTPDRPGTWYYVASFRFGDRIALLSDLEAGRATAFDGASGSFYVEPADPSAPGLLGRGRLEYVGEHHLRFAESGERLLKNGAGSPENWLGYYEFDGTFDQGGTTNDLNTGGHFDGLHHFDAHLSDYVDLGVPTWHGSKGRRLFGALGYLASRGVNSLYTVTYNLDGGDGQEVWPWAPSSNRLRFDVSKLAQWERVVDHMARSGITWHVVTRSTAARSASSAGCTTAS
jgi:hypothetical protein